MSTSTGQVAVGRLGPKGASGPLPSLPGFVPVLVLTKSSKYGSIGPYVLKDENNEIFENVWQKSKVYPFVPASKQTYSRWDRRVIWDHPGELHVDANKEPNDAYWAWREKLGKAEEAIRWPVGKKHTSQCLYALKEKGGRRLNYIEARKEIYLKEYCRLVKTQPQFLQLQQQLQQGQNLLIIEVDGPHYEDLSYYQQTYGVSNDFILPSNGGGSTILVSGEQGIQNDDIMLNDPKHPYGHGYCLARALLGRS
jgi:hypothetical protein